MREGAMLDYRIRLHGAADPVADAHRRVGARRPLRRSPGASGPYHWWRHEHRFEAVDGGTRVIDHVEYLPRVAWLSRGWVRRDVERIFAYRRDALLRELARAAVDRYAREPAT